MTKQYFVCEYDNNEQLAVVELTEEQYNNKINNFDREQEDFPVDYVKEYAVKNNISNLLDFFEQNNVVRCIHQDSECDIFIVQ